MNNLKIRLKRNIYTTTALIVCMMVSACNPWFGTETESVLSGYENGHEWVDLGLTSGLKWATCNIGATTPEGCGEYFAWGETTSKNNYTWETYKFRTSGDGYNYNVKFSKYNTDSYYGPEDNKTTLELTDDAAHVKWGGRWRMPTIYELDELMIECEWTYINYKGICGYDVKGPNGNRIFLPAAGYRHGASVYNVGSDGRYWSSSLYESDPSYAYNLYFYSGYVDWGSYVSLRRSLGSRCLPVARARPKGGAPGVLPEFIQNKCTQNRLSAQRFTPEGLSKLSAFGGRSR